MKAFLTPVLLASVVMTAACGQGGSNGNQAQTALEPVMQRGAPTPTSTSKIAAAPDCAPQPKLALATDFADPRNLFAPGSPARSRTEANFEAAWRKACASGVLRGHVLMDPKAAQPDTLFLKNAPDANVAAIYRDGEDNGPAAGRVMVLEYPFLPADGASHVPSADDLNEAIFCATQGATTKEEEEDGRCLVD